MPLKLRTDGKDGKDLMTEVFLLKQNPFRTSEIYSLDRHGTYVPEIYGDQFDEFYEKFFLVPMSKETNKQVIGAVWSSHKGDQTGKGYGKSYLMAEESKGINTDFGASKLRKLKFGKDEAAENPFLAGYCTFDQAKEVKSFPAALLDAVVFILQSPHGESSVHLALRQRIAGRVETEVGFESEAILEALQKALRKYRGLNVQLTHPKIEEFMQKLCHDDTEALTQFMRHEIGPRIKATQGFNFVHIFNAFLLIAGIVYVVYFVDQIENFARFARNQERDLKILRESMCQTSPTDGMASFVFQMHVHALQAIEDWWDSIEQLPSLDPKKLINATRIVDLQGLTTKQEAKLLTERYLSDMRPPGAKAPTLLHPFDADIIEAVRVAANGNPRRFLEKLGAILDSATVSKRRKIDLAFVTPLLEDDTESVSNAGISDQEDDLANPER